MLTVAYHPKLDCYNPYLRLYADALARAGVAAGPTLEVHRGFLRRHAGAVQALHVQWNPDHLWRPNGTTGIRGRVRSFARFWVYLRTARRLGYKVIWTLHDAERHDGDRWGDRAGYRLLARAADLCICHDENAVARYLGFGGRADRARVMRHGNYDPVVCPSGQTRAVTLAGLGLDPDRPTFLCQGIVRSYKNYESAVVAFGRLGPKYQLVVAGVAADPAAAGAVTAAAAGLPNVRVELGHTSDQRLADLAHASDGFVLPYRQITGSGALLIAWTFGRGVICSDLPYFADMLRLDPAAGVTFPLGDTGGLAAAVRAYLGRPSADRGLAARRLADRFDWDVVVRPVVEWYAATFPHHLRAEQTPTVVGTRAAGDE